MLRETEKSIPLPTTIGFTSLVAVLASSLRDPVFLTAFKAQLQEKALAIKEGRR